MLDKKANDKIVNEFDKSYKLWFSSRQDCIEQNKIDMKFKKEMTGKYTPSEIVGAIYPNWNKLRNIERDNADKLIKALKKLLIILPAENSFGSDLFDDYGVKVNIKVDYRGSHLKKIC